MSGYEMREWPTIYEGCKNWGYMILLRTCVFCVIILHEPNVQNQAKRILLLKILNQITSLKKRIKENMMMMMNL